MSLSVPAINSEFFDSIALRLGQAMPKIASGKHVIAYRPIHIWRIVPDELSNEVPLSAHCGWRVFLRKGFRLFSADFEDRDDKISMVLVRGRRATRALLDILQAIEFGKFGESDESYEIRYLICEALGTDDIWLSSQSVDGLVLQSRGEIADYRSYQQSLKERWLQRR